LSLLIQCFEGLPQLRLWLEAMLGLTMDLHLFGYVPALEVIFVEAEVAQDRYREFAKFSPGLVGYLKFQFYWS
jgi:hypothetical protein